MNPHQTLEQSAYAFLTDLETPLTLVESTSIYKGKSSPIERDNDENTTEAADKVHPSVTLDAEGNHEEAVLFTNIYQGVLAVTVEAIVSDTTDTQFDAICQEVFSKFNIQEIETNMTAAIDDFRLIQFRLVGAGSVINNGSNWQMTHRYMCVYAEADL
jgi:hypothetical protein